MTECPECRNELDEDEVRRYGLCEECYKSLIDYLIFFKLESKYK